MITGIPSATPFKISTCTIKSPVGLLPLKRKKKITNANRKKVRRLIYEVHMPEHALFTWKECLHNIKKSLHPQELVTKHHEQCPSHPLHSSELLLVRWSWEFFMRLAILYENIPQTKRHENYASVLKNNITFQCSERTFRIRSNHLDKCALLMLLWA